MTRSGLVVVAVIGGLALLVIALAEISVSLYPAASHSIQRLVVARAHRYTHDVYAHAAFAMPRGYVVDGAAESIRGRAVRIASARGASPDIIEVEQFAALRFDRRWWEQWLSQYMADCGPLRPAVRFQQTVGARRLDVYRRVCADPGSDMQIEMFVPAGPSPKAMIWGRGRVSDWSDAPILALFSVVD
jgi:hypothetical protein